MNFFEHQEKARKRTSLLVFCYAASVVFIVLGVYLAIVGAFYMLEVSDKHSQITPEQMHNLLLNPSLFWAVTPIVLGLMLLGTLYKLAQLRQGGSVVAEMLGGRLIPANSNSPTERKILNVVEEMSIASGVPVPPVYLLEKEEGINAFAAGYGPSDAVVAVTKGCVEQLSRDELQGVIAHEFSHIFNGDMRLNLNLMGTLNGILMLYFAGNIMFRIAANSGRSSSSEKGADPRLILLVLGGLFMLLGLAGVFFGNIIKAAVSRQREFLADASAVQFTRNPQGIGGALRKIGEAMFGSKISNNNAHQASHLFFADGIRRSFIGLFATHPALTERIRRIDSSQQVSFSEEPVVGGAAQVGSAFASMQEQGTAVSLSTDGFTSAVGNVEPAHIEYAETLLRAIPSALLERSRESFGAQTIVYCLLLSDDKAVQDKQLSYLSREVDARLFNDVLRALPEYSNLASKAKLPLVDLSTRALKQLSVNQYQAFLKAVDVLISADEKVSLFEYALKICLTRRLDAFFGKAPRRKIAYNDINQVREPLFVVFSALSYMGSAEVKSRQEAYNAALTEVGLAESELLSSAQCGLVAIESSLKKLSDCAPLVKQKVLSGASASVLKDGKVTVSEAELLRAVSDYLDCPVPPFLQQ